MADEFDAEIMLGVLLAIRRAWPQLALTNPWRGALREIAEEIANDVGPQRVRLVQPEQDDPPRLRSTSQEP